MEEEEDWCPAFGEAENGWKEWLLEDDARGNKAERDGLVKEEEGEWCEWSVKRAKAVSDEGKGDDGPAEEILPQTPFSWSELVKMGMKKNKHEEDNDELVRKRLDSTNARTKKENEDESKS